MTWRSFADWQADAPRILQDEAVCIAALGDGTPSGTCDVCGRHARFARERSAASPWREGLACVHCRCNARQRAAAALLFDRLRDPAAARVCISEQASPLYVALRRRILRLHGSEYSPSWVRRLRLGAWLWRQGVATWVRHGDVTALRCADAAFDAVLSLDVLEHVPDYRAALAEFARVLRPDGTLVLTVPFHEGMAASEAIAQRRTDGSVEHLGAPEYHGDPLGGGVLCYHHFGWDLLEAMRAVGFVDAVACRVHGMARGLPQGQWVLWARR